MNAEQLQRVIDGLREPTLPPPSAMGPALLTICVALVTFAALILAAGS